MITHLNSVTVYVSDQQRSVDFYVDKLGFEIRADQDMGPAGRWIEVCPPGAATGLVLVRGDAFDRPDRVGKSADLILATGDIAATTGHCASGVPVTEPHPQAWGRRASPPTPTGSMF